MSTMDDVTYVADNEEMEKRLILLLQNAMTSICKLVEEQRNNPMIGESYEEPVPPIERLTSILETLRLEGCTPDRIMPETALLEHTVQLLEHLEEDYTSTDAKKAEEAAKSDMLCNNIIALEKITNARETENETLIDEKSNIERNLAKRFKKEKEDLKIILNTLFPENYELQQLIGDITTKYYKEGPDKYTTVERTDASMANIEILLQSQLFEVNPQDKYQIRMIDL